MTGYADRLYVQSLAEFGQPLHLSGCRGWALRRSIADSDWQDAMGVYPVFACSDWQSLAADLENHQDNLVSVVLVTDPFGTYDEPLLRRCFPDRCFPFKNHYIVDLSTPLEAHVSDHHHRNAQRALKAVSVARIPEPAAALADWIRLYDTLIARHRIRGIAAFSRPSFERQLAVPGMVAYRAAVGPETVGMVLWLLCGDRGYYHLGAYSAKGYELRASFAIFWQAMRTFAQEGVRWLTLGAGAGTTERPEDGLARFKHGWATDTRPTYLCGRIFNRERYRELTEARNLQQTNYFPAYRAGEFQ